MPDSNSFTRLIYSVSGPPASHSWYTCFAGLFDGIGRSPHIYEYGFNRFLRCNIPFRIRSFTVPRGCPSAVAISVWLIP